jgi:hypothetical protein
MDDFLANVPPELRDDLFRRSGRDRKPVETLSIVPEEPKKKAAKGKGKGKGKAKKGLENVKKTAKKQKERKRARKNVRAPSWWFLDMDFGFLMFDF